MRVKFSDCQFAKINVPYNLAVKKKQNAEQIKVVIVFLSFSYELAIFLRNSLATTLS